MTRIISTILILLFLLVPEFTSAADKITPYPPRIKQSLTIEEKIKEKKGKTWLWVLLGVAIAGGVAAVSAGSGSGENSSSGSGTVMVSY